AGVGIDILVRGICSLRPGITGLSENIRVRSILGRFLEHSRLYYFDNDGHPDILIGSADMMPRNLDRRVEALVSVKDAKLKGRLKRLIGMSFEANRNVWQLDGDGTWTRLTTDEDEEPRNLQDQLMRRATPDA
ncbi:MAG: RNA degradosome polyphosphate kinase, partial [Actinomycetota bacterium]